METLQVKKKRGALGARCALEADRREATASTEALDDGSYITLRSGPR